MGKARFMGGAMQTLETVLGLRRRELVQALEGRAGMSGELAERFVSLAGPDLLESIEWQVSELDSRRLSAPATVRDVLSAMGADRIASSLGSPAPTSGWVSVPSCPVRCSSPSAGSRPDRDDHVDLAPPYADSTRALP